MATTADPILRNWYHDLAIQESFRVVALDEEADTIEVQYYFGEIAEFDSESWYASDFVPIEPPEEWNAPYDDVEGDDLGYSDSTSSRVIPSIKPVE